MQISKELLTLESILSNKQATDNMTVAQFDALSDMIEQQFIREAETQFKAKIGDTFYYCYQSEEEVNWKYAKVTVEDFTLSLDDHIIIHLRNHHVGIHCRPTLEGYCKLAIVPTVNAAKHYCMMKNKELEEAKEEEVDKAAEFLFNLFFPWHFQKKD